MKKEISVIFRKFNNGNIIALFPYEIETVEGNIMSYEHNGQHGIANYDHVVYKTKLATEDEYSDLLNELKEIYAHYKFKLLKKMNRKIYSNELLRLKFKS